jgi:hypothetical protein
LWCWCSIKEPLDRVATAVEDAEATLDGELDWTRHRQPAKGPTAVYSVRIPVERIEELRQSAAECGVALAPVCYAPGGDATGYPRNW